MSRRRLARAARTLCPAVALLLVAAVPDVRAQTPPATSSEVRRFDIPAGPLNAAITRFVAETGVLVAGDAVLTAGKNSPGVRGDFPAAEALQRLLAGTGVAAVLQPSGGFVLRAPAAQAAPQPSAAAGGPAEAPTLPAVRVQATAEPGPGELPKPYAGGQVARGARAGLLGNQDLFDSPFSISAVTAQRIADTQAQTVTEVLKDDAGVVSNYGRGRGRDNLSVRGFDVSGTQFLYDGLPGLTQEYASQVAAIERVELQKGLGTFLHGVTPFGTPGGTVNLVPKRAPDGGLNEVSLGHLGRGQAWGAVDVARRFGLDGRWGIRVNARLEDGEVALRDSTTRSSVTAMAVDYRGERLRWTGDVIRDELKTSCSLNAYGLSAGLAIPPAPDPRNNPCQAYERFNNRNLAVFTRAEWDLNDDWLLFGGAGTRKYYQNVITGSASITNDRGDFDAESLYSNATRDGWSWEAGVRGRFATGAVKHQVVFTAAAYQRETQENGFVFGFTSYTSNIYVPRQTPSSVSIVDLEAQFAAAGSYQFDDNVFSSLGLSDTLSLIDDRLRLTVGGRLQRIQQEEYDTTGTVTSSYDKRRFSPGVGLVYKLQPALSIYGNYLQGLQQGPQAPLTVVNAGEIFAPVVTRQIEVGTKIDFGTLGVTLALYDIQQPNAGTDPASNRFELSGEQTNRGIELAVFGEPVRRWRVNGGVSLIRSKLSGSASGGFEGNEAPGVPRWRLSLGTEHDLNALPGLTLSGRVISSGKQYLEPDNLRVVPGWTTLDVGARYRFKSWGSDVLIRAGVENATGRRYWSGGAYGLYPGAPRTFYVSTAVRF